MCLTSLLSSISYLQCSLSCSFLSLYSSHSPLYCLSTRETAIDGEGPFSVLFVSSSFIQPRSFRFYILLVPEPNLSFPPAHTKNIFMREMIGEFQKPWQIWFSLFFCILSCFYLTGGLERCIIQMSPWAARYRSHTWAVKCKIHVLFLTSSRSRNLLNYKNAIYNSLKLYFYSCNEIQMWFLCVHWMCRKLFSPLSLYWSVSAEPSGLQQGSQAGV